MNALLKTVADGWPMGWVLPAGRSTKQRLSGKLDVKGVKVAIVLGRTVSTSAEGDDVTAYEFEADVNGSLTQEARRVYEAVIERLMQAGLETSHVLPDDGQSDFGFMQDVYRGLLR